MKLPKPVQALVLLSILLCFPEFSFSQCASRFEIKKLDNKDSNTAQVELKIITPDNFVCALSIMEGTDEKTLSTFSGNGNTSRILDFKIKHEALYRVTVSFEVEKKFLCKKKFKIIDLTDTQ